MSKRKPGFEDKPVPVGKARKVFLVDGKDHGPADVAQAAGEGLVLRWPRVEGFFELPEETVRAMGAESRRNYHVARELWLQAKAAPGEGYYGELEMIPLISNTARNRFKLEAPADAHVYWPTMDLAKAAEAAGYKYVKKESQFKRVIPEGTPEGGDKDKVYLFNRDTGKAEHVAMYIPKARYEAHLRAVEGFSKRRMKGADENAAEATKEALAQAGVQGKKFESLKVSSKTHDEKPVPMEEAYEGT